MEAIKEQTNGLRGQQWLSSKRCWTKATTKIMKSRALKNIVPLITHMHAWAERADAGNPGHSQPPAHLNGQRVCTKPETKQAAHAPVTYRQLKVWLWHRTNACKPTMIRAQLGPLKGADLGPGSNVLLTRVPHEKTHGPMAIIKSCWKPRRMSSKAGH